LADDSLTISAVMLGFVSFILIPSAASFFFLLDALKSNPHGALLLQVKSPFCIIFSLPNEDLFLKDSFLLKRYL
jgi:hypothetical protein